MLHPGDVGEVACLPLLGGSLDCGLGLGAVGQVGRRGDGPAVGVERLHRLDGVVQSRLVDVEADDGQAVDRQRDGRRPADA